MRRHIAQQNSTRTLVGVLGAVVLAGGLLATPGSASAHQTADAATSALVDWNGELLAITVAEPLNPPLEARNVAIESAAVYDAVTSITRRFPPYRIRIVTAPMASTEAAVSAAAQSTLVALYPDQTARVDAFAAAKLATIADGQPKQDGIAVGRAVAASLLSLRADDGSGAQPPYTPGTAPGAWQPTPPLFRPALDPGWGSVTPFVLRRGDQFRPGPPPALTSARYTADFAEIQAIGSASSTVRTAEQTTVAQLWTVTGPQLWNEAVQQLVIARHLDASAAARAFALLAVAGADAFIASWDAKYTYNQWRPVTAIRAADTDGNAATEPDPSWLPLVVTPPFPDYIAGHTTYGGAAEMC